MRLLPRLVTALLVALSTVALVGVASVEAGAAAKKRDRLDHDLRVRLRVRGRKKPQLKIDVRVRNRGRLDQDGVEVVLHDGDAERPVWREVISLAAGKKKRFRFRLDRGSVGDLLVAESRAVIEDRPDDNEDEADISPPPASLSAAERGRDLYVPLCSGCHGPDGRGGTARSDDDDDDDDDDHDDDDGDRDEDDGEDGDDEDISRESWEEFLEAFREGEDGMPVYPELTARDAKDIVAYLRDPGAVAPPTTPPVEPPLGDATPTYTDHVKTILDARCVSCHGPNFAAAGIALDTYSVAAANAAATLDSVAAGRMPTAGPLPEQEVATIRRWVEGGAPE